MGRMPSINAAEARRIKELLWDNTPVRDIIEEFGISQPIVSNIKTGKSWYEIPWPDSTIGGMSEMRRRQLSKSNRRSTITQQRLGGNNQEIPQNELEMFIKANGMHPEEFYRRGLEAAAQLQAQRNKENRERILRQVEEKMAMHRADPNYVEPTPPPRREINHNAFDYRKQRMFEWDDCVQLLGDLPIVQVADQGEDEFLKYAIRTAMKLTENSRGMWRDRHFLKVIAELKQKFINFEEIQNAEVSIDTQGA